MAGFSDGLGAVGVAAGSAATTAVQNMYNRKIAAAQNRFNYKLFQEQNQFNKSMWSAANAYNSPSAQVDRLRSAGLNPKLAMVDSGLAGEVSSAPAQPAAAYDQRAPDLIGSAMQGFQAFQQFDRNAKENQILGVQASFEEQKQIQSLEKQKADILEVLARKDLDQSQRRHYESQAAYVDEQLSYLRDTHEIRVQREQQGLVNDKQAELNAQQERAESNWRITYGQSKLTLEQAVAASQIRLNKAEIHKLASEAANFQASTWNLSELARLNHVNYEDSRAKFQAFMRDFDGYANSLKNAHLISDEQLKQAQGLTQQLAREYGTYAFTRGFDDSAASKLLGSISAITTALGNILHVGYSSSSSTLKTD